MKRIFLITILIVGLTATYGFADMDDHMGSGQGMMERGHSSDESSEHSEGMGPGMMGGYGMMGQGHMGGMMGGYGYRGNDPEAYEKYQKKYQKYMDDTVGLRKKLHNKKFEYFEALRNPDTTRKSRLKLEKELMDLKWKIYEKAPE